MVSLNSKGNLNKTASYLYKMKNFQVPELDSFGKKGVAILKSNTPVKTGKTASSWYYEIEKTRGSVSIVFKNSNITHYVPIAIILQYGHATRNGGWVEGIDYINPAMQEIFKELADEAWKEVSK